MMLLRYFLIDETLNGLYDVLKGICMQKMNFFIILFLPWTNIFILNCDFANKICTFVQLSKIMIFQYNECSLSQKKNQNRVLLCKFVELR